jgi:hypothetical protein
MGLPFRVLTDAAEVVADAFSLVDEDVTEAAFTAAKFVFAGANPTSL